MRAKLTAGGRCQVVSKKSNSLKSSAESRALLAEHGLRYSRPREVILSYFRERARHVNAEAVYLALKERGHNFSLSTVYLNLGVLREVGLVREFHGAAGESLYDSNISLHYHLICKRCNRVMDLPHEVMAGETPMRLQLQAEEASGWQLDEPNLNLYGLCVGCQV